LRSCSSNSQPANGFPVSQPTILAFGVIMAGLNHLPRARDATARQYARFIACGRSRPASSPPLRILQWRKTPRCPEDRCRASWKARPGPSPVIRNASARSPRRIPPSRKCPPRERRCRAVDKDQAMARQADVFRYVPGALTRPQGDRQPRPDLLAAATARPGRDFFVNGVRERCANPLSGLYNLERVKVLKGPAAIELRGRGRREVGLRRVPNRRLGRRAKTNSRRAPPRPKIMPPGP